MIRFKSLRFNNAVTFGSVKPIPLEKQGRVFVLGKNADTGGSNGAGKSTVFEVLQHILFSTTSKGFSRNKFAGAGYKAQLELEVDGHEYKILQFRGAKKAERRDGYKIWKDGVEVTPQGTRHIADCIEYIKGVIGITEAEFRGYIYLAQEGPGHVLISGKAAAKRDYLSDLFTLDRFDIVRDGVEAELSKLNAAVAALSEKGAVRDELKEQLAEIPMSEEDFEEFFESLKATREFVNKKYKEWGGALKKADANEARAAERGTVESELNEILSNWKEIDIPTLIEEKTLKRRGLGARIEKYEGYKALVEEKTELEESYVEDLEIGEAEATKALNEVQAKVSVIQNELKSVRRRIVLEEQLPDIEGVAPDTTDRLKEGERALGVMEFQLKESKETLEKLSELTGSECPTCGQTLDVDSIAKQRERTETTIKTVEAALKTTRTEVKALVSLSKKLTEHAKIRAQIGELPAGSLDDRNAALSDLGDEVERLEECVELARENARTAKRLGELAGALASVPSDFSAERLDEYREKERKLEGQIQKLKTLNGLKKRLETLPEIESLPAEEYKKISELATYYEEAKRELAVQLAEAKSKREALTTLTARLEVLEGQLAEWEKVQKKRTLFEAMKAAYGPKGLKIVQLKKICNAICRTLPKYTSIMFQEQRVEFFVDDDPDTTEIEFYIRRFTSEGPEEYPVGKLSGGEKKRLAVAFIFALADLVAPRKKSNLIILDEVGDGLDPIGESAFASQLLPQLSQETVIITSHRPGIESARFDREWTIHKKDNRSSFKLD